jgi:hypothetical protein
MEKYYDLTYHIVKKKYLSVEATEYVFTTKDGDSFGRSFENHSFTYNNDKYVTIHSFFGNQTDELLLKYLNDKFGDSVTIRRIS